MQRSSKRWSGWIGAWIAVLAVVFSSAPAAARSIGLVASSQATASAGSAGLDDEDQPAGHASSAVIGTGPAPSGTYALLVAGRRGVDIDRDATPAGASRFALRTRDFTADPPRDDTRWTSAGVFLSRLVDRFDVLDARKLLANAASLGVASDMPIDGRSAATMLRHDAFAIGGDSRLATRGLSQIQDRRLEDAFVMWVPNTRLALTGGYAWLRRATDLGRHRGAYLSLQVTY